MVVRGLSVYISVRQASTSKLYEYKSPRLFLLVVAILRQYCTTNKIVSHMEKNDSIKSLLKRMVYAIALFLFAVVVIITWYNNRPVPSNVNNCEQVDEDSIYFSSSSYEIPSTKTFRTSDRCNDEEYWNSVAREKALKEMGREDAAKLERNARLNYMQGGGYHSSDGTPQVHFQGSKEQEEQLRMMDEMGW